MEIKEKRKPLSKIEYKNDVESLHDICTEKKRFELVRLWENCFIIKPGVCSNISFSCNIILTNI